MCPPAATPARGLASWRFVLNMSALSGACKAQGTTATSAEADLEAAAGTVTICISG